MALRLPNLAHRLLRTQAHRNLLPNEIGPCLLRSLSTSSQPPSLDTATTRLPQQTLDIAITSLKDFGTSLQDIAERVDLSRSISDVRQPISVAEIALHSRDANPDDFASAAAQAARKELIPHAKSIEQDLRALAEKYHQVVQPQMEAATKLCQETPCGGATWELDMETLQQKAAESSKTVSSSDGKNQTVKLKELRDTPCGRLQLASMEFLETTRQTKAPIAMAARARLLLSLAQESNQSLQSIRQSANQKEQGQIQARFRSEVVPTPWVRGDKEYESLLRLQEELGL